jgi:hypothetical protein
MKTVKKTSVKKYQAGGSKDTGKVVIKNRKDSEGIASERRKGNTVYIPKTKTKALMQKGGVAGENTPKSKTSKQETKSKKPVKPEAAYGMAVKPSMMKKGGTVKKK